MRYQKILRTTRTKRLPKHLDVLVLPDCLASNHSGKMFKMGGLVLKMLSVLYKSAPFYRNRVRLRFYDITNIIATDIIATEYLVRPEEKNPRHDKVSRLLRE